MNPLPVPVLENISDKGEVTDPWERFFTTIAERLSRIPIRLVDPIALTGQTASIAATDICPQQPAQGLYRITYYARITTVGSVSSSLTVTLSWTDHGVVQSFSGTAITGNTTTSFQTDTLMVFIDANTAITYATTYASNLAGEMAYQLYVIIEAVGI